MLIPCTGLLKRDREEYADYWSFAGFESHVEYHSTLVLQPSRVMLSSSTKQITLLSQIQWPMGG